MRGRRIKRKEKVQGRKKMCHNSVGERGRGRGSENPGHTELRPRGLGLVATLAVSAPFLLSNSGGLPILPPKKNLNIKNS